MSDVTNKLTVFLKDSNVELLKSKIKGDETISDVLNELIKKGIKK